MEIPSPVVPSVGVFYRFQWSTADYAAHRLAIGKNELSALVADLGLNLKARILTGKPRETALRQEKSVTART